MSIPDHFDQLSAYRASAIRLELTDGEPEDLLGEGGGLQEAFESLGRRRLVGVLRDPAVQTVRLADGDLEVAAERRGAGARLVVRWDGDTVVDEEVEIGLPEAPAAGPWFRPDPRSEVDDAVVALHAWHRPLYALADIGGAVRWFGRGLHGPGTGQRLLRGVVPPMDPASLGSASFRDLHGARWAYVAGAMAGGIASVDLVAAMARAGLMAFYGAGGVPLAKVEQAVADLARIAPDGPWGANLLHNPVEPALEERTVDAYLAHGVRRVSASAYTRPTPAVVRYRLHGIHAGPDGRVICPNQVLAKVSRSEVATRFLQPPPAKMLVELVKAGAITRDQARLARQVPLASAITAEADSGGHTDHRPLTVILPELSALRDQLAAEHGWTDRRPHVGAAGGLGTPAAVWAAFAMGADYVLTGSVNQASREAGTSDLVKAMLADAGPADVATGPAPDMFEMGARVQVLGRGALYAQRAQRLYDLYKRHGSLDALPDTERKRVERFFQRTIAEVWDETRAYWTARDPAQVARAEAEPRHRMALVFRWYLGMTSRWARTGDASRKRDFQVWCGPAMGAFNAWARETSLAPVGARGVVAIATALMHGAAAHARLATARSLGLPVPPGAEAVGVVHSARVQEAP